MENKFLDSLLAYYHLSKEEYLLLIKEVDLSSFSDGYSFKDISIAKEIALNAIKLHKRIVVYGDYDADGIMGTSILVKMFKMLDYHVDYYIPSRYIDGYGLNESNATKAIGKYDLVITVDNGIAAKDAIDILKNANIEVIVIDHHTVQLPLPRADAIVHPEVSSYGDVATSGAYTAFMFSKEMLGYYDKYLATLAAISLISDMMPLQKYNRNLLRAVFKDYKDEEFLPISLLADHKQLDENVIGMLIAPKINSIGRMIEDKSINLIVKYFVEDNPSFILTYYDYMNGINEQRKFIQKDSANLIGKDLDESSIVSLLEVKEGLIGLVANQVVNKINKPAIVFTHSLEGTLKGSARSIEGFNIMEAFKSLEKYMLGYGGHALAGGCSIKESDYEAFKQDFLNLVSKADLTPKEKEHIDISINDISYDNYLIYHSFSPFGEGHKAPILRLNNIKVDALTFSKTNEHILTKIGQSTKLVGFYFSKDYLSQFKFINMDGKLDISIYKNNVTTEFHINKIYGN